MTVSEAPNPFAPPSADPGLPSAPPRPFRWRAAWVYALSAAVGTFPMGWFVPVGALTAVLAAGVLGGLVTARRPAVSTPAALANATLVFLGAMATGVSLGVVTLPWTDPMMAVGGAGLAGVVGSLLSLPAFALLALVFCPHALPVAWLFGWLLHRGDRKAFQEGTLDGDPVGP